MTDFINFSKHINNNCPKCGEVLVTRKLNDFRDGVTMTEYCASKKCDYTKDFKLTIKTENTKQETEY